MFFFVWFNFLKYFTFKTLGLGINLVSNLSVLRAKNLNFFCFYTPKTCFLLSESVRQGTKCQTAGRSSKATKIKIIAGGTTRQPKRAEAQKIGD